MERKMKDIIRHGNSGDVKSLSKFVGDMDINDILQIISKFINEPQFSLALMFIFDGLSDSGQSQMARLKITEKVLQEFQKCDIALVRAMDVTSRLLHELPNFSTGHLTKIADLCVECICKWNNKSRNSSHLCWKELLPTILCLLLERVKVTQNNTQMTGEEYKSQILKTICQAKWSSDVAVSLAGMFSNISMTSDEHLKIVNKLCSYIEELSPQELPPLAHEMLEFCHERHVMPLIMRLNFYFSSRLYKNVSNNPDSVRPGTQLMHFDTEEITAHSIKEVCEAESTVLSYIRKSASQNPSIGELVNIMKKLSCRAPEYVLQPFLIGMLFSIGTLRSYEEQVFSILKSALQRCLVEDQMNQDSAWMRSLKLQPVDLENLVNSIIEGSKAGQPDAEEGLVNLAFVLLQCKSAPNQESLAESLWGYGITILVQLCKRQGHVTGSVLQRLSDQILTGNSVLQFIRCLAELCAKLKLVVMEKQSLIIDLLGNLFFFTPDIARIIIVAVMPIVLLAPSVCNNLVLTLRKAAYSRNVNTRKMSVYGFLEMLKSFQIVNTGGIHLSQGSGESAYSGYTMMSQVAVEVHSQAPRTNANSKEAVCLEVLNALRGFLTMQAEVKACLFEGLAVALHVNPGLTGPVLTWLHRHLIKQCDLDNLPPLHFEESVVLKGDEVILQEPLALLVQLAQEVYAVALKMESETNECEPILVLQGMLDKLVTRMARCSCENFGIEVDANLSDSDPETKKSAEVFRQALGVYEALMNYVFSTWSLESQEPAEKVISLFKCHAGLMELAKSNSKLGKKELDATAKSQAKKGAGRPSKTSSFKLPPSILGLSFLKKALSLLYNDSVPWSTNAAANSLKGKLDFHTFVTNVLAQFVGNLNSEATHSGNFKVLYQCKALCRVLYPKVALAINEIDGFSRPVAVQLLESFLGMFKIVATHFRKKLATFVKEITWDIDSESIGDQLSPLLETMHTMLQNVLSEEDKSELIDIRFSELLIEILSVCSVQLPPQGEHCAKVTEWIREIATQRKLSNKNVVKGLVNLLITLTGRTKPESSVVKNIIINLRQELSILPDLDDDDSNPTTVSYPVVSAATKEIVLQSVCNTLRDRLEEVEWVTKRASAELTMLDHQPGDTEEASLRRLKDTEQLLVVHLGQCLQCCVSLSACKPPEGTLTNVLLRLYGDVYKTITFVAKYFKSRSYIDSEAFLVVRFDKVVKVTGKGFTKHVFSFISYIGEKNDKSLKKAAETSKQKKILRETRYIPITVRKKEEFDQSIIQLAKQCKAASLSEYIKYNVARDFNIKAEKLEKALEKSDDHSHDTTLDGENSGDDVPNEESRSPVMSSPTRDEEDEEEEKVGNDRDSSSSSEDEAEIRPPSKKKRLSTVF